MEELKKELGEAIEGEMIEEQLEKGEEDFEDSEKGFMENRYGEKNSDDVENEEQ